jgi:ATP-dependent helicase/nuclease subunit B
MICAPAGYGKTHYIYDTIDKVLHDKSETKVYIIVPEQESVKSEKALLEHFGNTLNRRAEILNFSRLANRVFREAGGITYDFVTNGGKDLLVATLLEDAREELEAFSAVCEDEGFITSLRAELDYLRLNGINAKALSELSKDVFQKELNSERLTKKISQLSILSTLYDGALKHSGVDSVDDLNRLSQMLDEYDFFYNTTVFIDGFYDFTYPEYEIIKKMLSQSCNVYLTLPLVEEDTEEVFTKSSEAKKRLESICEEVSVPAKSIYLKERRKNQAEALVYLAERLMDGRTCEKEIDANGAVELISCKTPFDECVCVAREIVRLVKNGVRFKDIAVCAGSISEYGAMLEDVFDKYGIHYLNTVHDTLMSKPLVSFIFSALDAVSSGFYLPRVKRFLESPILPLDKEDRFLLTNYIDTWNINATLWNSESDWVMNPRGYVGKMNESDCEELERVNVARRLVAAPLQRFAKGIKSPKVKDKVSAIWDLLDDFDIKKKLVLRSEKHLSDSDFARSRDEASVWNLTLEALDRLCSVVGERETGIERFFKYMRIAFSDASFGRIPSSLDEVELGDIGFVRNTDVKHLFLMGFNEGSFPAVEEKTGIFTDNERRVLERFSDLFKADSQDRRLQNEVFHLLIAVSTPSDALHLIYHTASSGSAEDRPSFFAPMISSYLNIDVRESNPQSDFPISRKELEDWVLSNSEADNFNDIIEAIKEIDAEFAECLIEKCKSSAFKSESLTFKSPEKVFKEKLNMTQARLDTFSRCPFSYYSNYLLELRSRKKAEFKAAEIGSLVHKVLEDVLARISADGKKLCDVEAKEAERLARLSAEDYLRRTAPEISETSRRFKYLISRLVTFVVYIIENMREEFENSDFSPILFEENMSEEGVIPPYTVDLPNGSQLVFYGCVDRVDLYEDENGKKYLRVVDYKTKLGGKKFDLNDVINGINLQLLVYLFAIWQNGEKDTSCPAGIMYMPASNPSVLLASADDANGIKEAKDNEMKRSGLFLLDEKILTAMEHGLEGRILPIKKNKNGTFSSQASLATLEQFGALKRYTDKTFMNLAMKLQKGNIGAEPLCSGNLDSCKWCDFKPFCRYEGKGRKYVKHSHPWEEISPETQKNDGGH